MRKRVILWFRNDLRLDDNEALLDAAAAGDVIPVYVFDDRTYKSLTSGFGFRKTGAFRAKFRLEAVADLRVQLQAIGSDLVVRTGRSEDVVSDWAREYGTSWVFCNRERTDEEVRIQDALEGKLWNIGQELRYSRGKMLYHTADLPFPVSHAPDVFSQFRKEVERFVPVRDPKPAPTALPVLPEGLAAGELPTLEELGYAEVDQDKRAAIQHQGGETAGRQRLHYYLWGSDLAKTYKETRNELLGQAYSTKFSAWLAAGCLSPKRVYHELRRYEAECGANDSTYWIFFELLWRDFFRLMAKKYQNAIFQKRGPKGLPVPEWSENQQVFERWASGQTGVPFVDANMRELNATGFMSNRGRQNVASFLVKDLKLNWQMGAEYLESLLIDYDVASNWCNWNYVAGVGSDPREDRYFNILTQAKRYDADGDYVRTWVPELAGLEGSSIHRPDLLSQAEQKALGIQLGVDYPNALVPIAKWDKGGRRPGRGSQKGKRRNRGAAQAGW